jgi:hypothetical protein
MIWGKWPALRPYARRMGLTVSGYGCLAVSAVSRYPGEQRGGPRHFSRPALCENRADMSHLDRGVVDQPITAPDAGDLKPLAGLITAVLVFPSSSTAHLRNVAAGHRHDDTGRPSASLRRLGCYYLTPSHHQKRVRP